MEIMGVGSTLSRATLADNMDPKNGGRFEEDVPFNVDFLVCFFSSFSGGFLLKKSYTPRICQIFLLYPSRCSKRRLLDVFFFVVRSRAPHLVTTGQQKTCFPPA